MVAGKATSATRTSNAKPAALDAVDRNAAMGVGAPWYTSGAQKWKGTAATLNAKPASTIMSAPSTAHNGASVWASPWARAANSTSPPAKPYSRLKP